MLQFVQDIYEGLSTFMTGMKVTGGYVRESNLPSAGNAKDPATFTIDYDGVMEKLPDGSMRPKIKVAVADRFRGHLHNDAERCIVCKACAKACPIDCFWIDGEKTEAGKLRPSRFDIDLLKCMYCGLCVNVCPTGCLTMTKEWWGATFDHDDGTNGHGQVRHFGVGYYTPEEKAEVERKRLEIAEAKKKALAAKAAADAAKKQADAAAKATAPAPDAAKTAASAVVNTVVVTQPAAEATNKAG